MASTDVDRVKLAAEEREAKEARDKELREQAGMQ